jgi:Kef-type K+ transport system membrane component KefB
MLGVALTATSIAITADTLREVGKLGTPAAKAIIGAAVIDDVLALMALSIAREVGVSLESARLRVSKSFKEGAESLRIVFGAVFFTSLGVLADLRELDASILCFTVVLTLVALATKVTGCGTGCASKTKTPNVTERMIMSRTRSSNLLVISLSSHSAREEDSACSDCSCA